MSCKQQELDKQQCVIGYKQKKSYELQLCYNKQEINELQCVYGYKQRELYELQCMLQPTGIG